MATPLLLRRNGEGIQFNGVRMATPLSLRRNGDGMATSPFHLHLKGVDGQSNMSKEAWRWHGHFSIPYKGVWMATPLSLRRNGDGMATSPFHLKGCGWQLHYL